MAPGRAAGLLALVGLLAAVPASRPQGAFERVGTIRHGPIREASALAASPSHPGVFWTLNDSLNPPALYAIDRSGRCLAEFDVQAVPNIDWEALAADDRGYLYIGDIGNNVFPGGLMVRQVHKLKEPPLPERMAATDEPVRGTLAVEATYEYTFPGKPFDAEAMFFRDGRIYIIEKTPGPTRLYRLDVDRPRRGARLVRVCELPQVRTATDASLSADGRRLAVCGYDRVVVFDRDPAEPIERLAEKRPLTVPFQGPGVEACSWDGERLLLASEGRAVYSLRVPQQNEPAKR